MNQLKQKRGITLIALVITIIVMLILAGVSISISVNGGLFDYAKRAGEETEIAKEMEAINLEYIITMEAITGGISTTEFENNLKGSLSADIEVIEAGLNKYVILNHETNRAYEIVNGKPEYIGKAEDYNIEITTLARINNNEISTSPFMGNTYNVIRRKIKTLTFQRGLNGIEEADGSWDASDEANGEIMAWYKADGDNFDVWIGSKNGGKIYLNEDSSNLFNNIGSGISDSNIDIQINGINNIDTSLVENMDKMFCSCGVTEIDLSNFNTSNVTSMCGMFFASRFTNLDLSSFDTSSVTDMSEMFGCVSYTDLDLSGFDINSVDTMEGMFYDSRNLQNLNISNFLINDSINIGLMFYDCSKVKTEFTIVSNSVINGDEFYYEDVDIIFGYAATATGAQIVVNYTTANEQFVSDLIASQKSPSSNVILGRNIDLDN